MICEPGDDLHRVVAVALGSTLFLGFGMVAATGG